MARSSTKAASESDDTPVGEETLDFERYDICYFLFQKTVESHLSIEHNSSPEKGQNYSRNDGFLYYYFDI